MVEDLQDPTAIPAEFHKADEIYSQDTAVGWAIMDSGATKTVCGETVWSQIAEYLVMRGLDQQKEVHKDTKDFRFGEVSPPGRSSV